MLKTKIIRFKYQNFIKPLLFSTNAEIAHNLITSIGEQLGKHKLSKSLTAHLLSVSKSNLKQKIQKINFNNPIGLAAGFDYDGHLAEIIPYAGFGFNTVGTVTAKEYKGNAHPRLARLPKSRSLLVNKGFKSEGVDKVLKRLKSKDLKEHTIGISVGSSNTHEINTIDKAIEDYVETFKKLKNEKYIKYFELNISCPNTSMTENFGEKENLSKLLKKISGLKISQPIFLKMANELDLNKTDQLVKISIHHGISGFIFSNLVKDRSNPNFDREEIKSVANLKGNFSGKPTYENSNKLIHHIYKEYGKKTLIIGCGGIFSAEDAYEKIKHGASLVQLITGMIYEGPQLIGEINEGLVELLKKDGFKDISEAIGDYHR